MSPPVRSVSTRRGVYVDSVTLMQVSRRVSALDGVEAALVAMATDLNLDLALGMGFELPEGLSPNEMLVALTADSPQALEAAHAELDRALADASRPAHGGGPQGAVAAPLTVAAAARGLEPGSAVALVSTPGRYAFADALDAVEAGLVTMIFSDNVPVEQEVLLKTRAVQAGTLVMGPDCGTAVLGGVGLGFANVVRPGPVGIVAASGTGAQHLMALLDGVDVGISHCLGVGGRDLSADVGGLSTLRALELLEDDAATELVVVVSKPPSDEVAARIRERASAMRTPVVLGLLGAGQPDLTETARTVAERAGVTWTPPSARQGSLTEARDRGSLRGLYAGGTLCDEAMLVAQELLGPIASNIPLRPADALADDLAARGHTMIDFGDDRLTRGRPHPMIDGSLRVERLRAEVADPGCGVLLLDVVLGLGADPDPAAGLVEPLREATEAGVPVAVAVIGTRDDPQGLDATCAALHDAGAHVHLSNADAARAAVALVSGDQEGAR